jgi:hypothetical protein
VTTKPWWRDPGGMPPDPVTSTQRRVWDVAVVGFLVGLFVLNLWFPQSPVVGVAMVVMLGVYIWNRTLGPGRTK